MAKAGFQDARLHSYTGFKSSPYTEGAIFFAEKPADAQREEGFRRLEESILPLEDGGKE